MWYTSVDPLTGRWTDIHNESCWCVPCSKSTDRAQSEAMFDRPYPLHYFTQRGMNLDHGTKIGNHITAQALSILKDVYQEVNRPPKLESSAGVTGKLFRPAHFDQCLPKVIVNSYQGYHADVRHNYGSYATRNDNLPSKSEIDGLSSILKHVGFYLVTDFPYIKDF